MCLPTKLTINASLRAVHLSPTQMTKNHSTILLLLVSLLLGTQSGCSQDEGKPDDNVETTALESLLQAAVDEDVAPGIIAAVIDAEGIRLIESAGIRKVGSDEALTVDDRMHLGSCTKAMTSCMLATMVEDGLLAWDTTLIEVFPELAEDIDESYHAVTLHELVTHRSGMVENASDWQDYQDLSITERRLSILKSNLAEASGLTKGSYQYSNLGYMVAGSMAEKVTGVSWETLMQERLFDPLGMTSAGFGVPGMDEGVDEPWGHYVSGGQWTPIQLDNPEAIGPAGTIHATFEDWATFIALFFSAASNEVLSTSQLDVLVDPIDDYAAGWFVVQRSWADGVALNHAGSNGLWYALVWVAPELNSAYVVAANAANADIQEVANSIVEELIEMND